MAEDKASRVPNTPSRPRGAAVEGVNTYPIARAKHAAHLELRSSISLACAYEHRDTNCRHNA